MNRKLEITKNLLAEILNYLMVFAVGVVVLTDFAKVSGNMAGLCAVAILPLLFYGIREKCRHFFLFLFLHILPCMFVLFIYEGENMAVFDCYFIGGSKLWEKNAEWRS